MNPVFPSDAKLVAELDDLVKLDHVAVRGCGLAIASRGVLTAAVLRDRR